MWKKDWFSKSVIRDKENLTEKEIRYIQRWNCKPFIPFFWIFRKEWDLFYPWVFYIPLLFLIGLQTHIISPLALILFVIMAFGFNIIFFRSERQIAWNRKSWKNFKHFRKAERKWNYILLGYFVFCLAAQLIPDSPKEEKKPISFPDKIECDDAGVFFL